MSLDFTHVTLGQRVLFGAGKAAEHVAAEVARLGTKKVMVIADERELELAHEVANLIDVATWHTEVVMHVPIEVAQRARRVASDNAIDLMVSVGGGSTTGLAKAIALTSGIPIIAVPTTYAGSEATNVWGLTENERKTTGTDDKVLPLTVIYDSELTLSLPVAMSVASGLNGLAHCVDSLWGPKADPINAALAAEGIHALNQGLPMIVEDPSSIEGRDLALYGAYLSAVSFSSAGSGIHHKLCHILGGTFNLPHAQTHAAVLPYVLAFNAPHAPEAETRMAAAFGADTALAGLQRLRTLLDAPRALADYGFTAEGIPTVVEQALAIIPDNNPCEVTADNLTELLTAALNGEDPASIGQHIPAATAAHV
ncbi:maleylacetate reductase [Corynebacterium sp. YIM 101645]|uniref:Maleylacetate reductase n=1 Tax=Corynebacterium lemuris TaxID=1859292 RepID=A0ABT2FVD2_9CORY|nr:maleylacetate reductase [Corynebacterium lemuris]MCS5479204.1 maleylacetate reductase [Corynebacterium lemuris]